MRASAIFRSVLSFIAIFMSLFIAGVSAAGQDIGVDVGGSAGIFRPKNPEAKKRANRPAPVIRRGNAARPPAAADVGGADRVVEVFGKSNHFRVGRRLAGAAA